MLLFKSRVFHKLAISILKVFNQSMLFETKYNTVVKASFMQLLKLV